MKSIFLVLMLLCSVASAQTSDVLYEKHDRTISDVFRDFSAAVGAAPVVKASTSYLDVPGLSGSCPSWTIHASFVGADIPLTDFFCNGAVTGAISAAGYAVLVVATYFAFRVAFL